MAGLQVRVKHNIANYDLVLGQEDSLVSLSERLLELTGVPISGQKMICSGKQLNTGEGWMERSLAEAGVKTGSKVMLLGKKFDPAQEEGYREVLEVEKKSGGLEMKIARISNEVDGIGKGHLEKGLVQEALAKLTKRCNMLNEEALKLLTSLDGIMLGEELEAKIKRKSVATKVNRLMDETDRKLEDINGLLEHGV